MKFIDDFGGAIIVALLIITVSAFVFVVNQRTHKQGQCSALGGVYLISEQACVKLEQIKLEQ